MTESIADMPQTKKYAYEPTLESWALHSLVGVVSLVAALPILLIVFIVAETLGVSLRGKPRHTSTEGEWDAPRTRG